MKVVSVVSRKGGSGKSTIATALAGTFALGGIPTAIADLDPQGSASAWGSSRPGERAPVKVVRSKPASLGDDLRRLAAEGTLLAVIDVPPHSDAAMAGALAVADAILVPSLPSAFDLHALHSILPAIRQAGKPVGAVLTSVTPGTLGLREAVAAVEAMDIPLVASVGRRMAYQYAAARGMCPAELDPKSEAAKEVESLCGWAIREMGAE